MSGVDVASTSSAATRPPLLAAVREGGISSRSPGPARGGGARAHCAPTCLVTNAKSEQLARIAERVAAGDVRFEISEAMPLADVKRAHELSEVGDVRGKLARGRG